MSALQTFRHYRISQDPQGGAVELWRSDSEIVCLAVDTLRQVFVELHVAMPGEVERDHKQFILNCQVAQQVRHRNILSILDAGEDEGADYYVSDYVDGERLETFVARNQQLPPWLAILAAKQVADGLAALSHHMRLLAGVDVFNATISLTGETPAEYVVKLADFGLARELTKGAVQAQVAEARAIMETGRLFYCLLTGVMLDGSNRPADSSRLPPEFVFLLDAIFDPQHLHHPRTIEQLRTLLFRCAEDLPMELGGFPEKISPPLRPRLPLQVNFLTGAQLAEALSDDFQIDQQPFDSLAPYRHAATMRATRQPVTVQVLPPDRLMPPDYLRAVRQAMSRINSMDHPNLIRVLDIPDEDAPQFYVEEACARHNLASVVRLRGGLTPMEAVLVLEQLEEASKQAEACGLVAVVRSPRELQFQFTGPGGEAALPGERELAGAELSAWPAFRIRVRTYPTTLNLAQPEAFLTERFLPASLPAVEPSGQQKQSSFLIPASARDYALLTSFMIGSRDCSDKVRHLIFDYMGNRKSSALGGNREFMERICTAVGRSLSKPSLQRGSMVVKKKKPILDREENGSETSAGFDQESGSDPLPATSDFMPLGRDSISLPGKKDRISSVGFAEALFGGNQAPAASEEEDEEPALPKTSAHGRQPEPTRTERTFLDGLDDLPDEDEDYPAPYLTDEDRRPNILLLILLVVLVSALLAGAIAHFTGTGYWIKRS